jgi:hypothetical protein
MLRRAAVGGAEHETVAVADIGQRPGPSLAGPPPGGRQQQNRATGDEPAADTAVGQAVQRGMEPQDRLGDQLHAVILPFSRPAGRQSDRSSPTGQLSFGHSAGHGPAGGREEMRGRVGAADGRLTAVNLGHAVHRSAGERCSEGLARAAEGAEVPLQRRGQFALAGCTRLPRYASDSTSELRESDNDDGRYE